MGDLFQAMEGRPEEPSAVNTKTLRKTIGKLAKGAPPLQQPLSAVKKQRMERQANLQLVKSQPEVPCIYLTLLVQATRRAHEAANACGRTEAECQRR